MKLAVIGSRSGIPAQTVLDYVRALPSDTVIISGGARGVDTWAKLSAQTCGLQYIELPADWSLGRNAGHLRNQQIVDTADQMTAFWDGTSPGTRDAISRMVAADKPVRVFQPHISAEYSIQKEYHTA